ncbi:MAG: hypothetical protein U1C33_00770, partial [Candidatus Cloacimonadaceae bacterium]|nr:hypothetical protein [Candidatus Cloacimonadaceae bacterium]
FFMFFAPQLVFAQIPDDYELMKKYTLQKDAVEMKTLVDMDSLKVFGNKPFTGFAYERYPDQKLYQVVSYRRGLQHGPMMVWYPDGSPQLYTNYRMGSPHGRFVGWYTNGRVIYNLVLNQGKLGGDFLYEEDDSRMATETEVIEIEGTDND